MTARTRIPKQLGRPLPRRSVGPAVGTFFRKRMRHHKGPLYREPFVLEPWQQNTADLSGDLDLIYEVDEHGRRVWLDVGYGVARGNGKSPVVSGCGGIELLSRRDSPEIVMGSGSRDQAKHVFQPIKWNVDHGELGRYLTAYANVIKPRFRDGVMNVVSADGALHHGGSASVGIVDELHVFTTAKQVELVAAIDSSLKRDDAWSWWISTAGHDKTSLLGERYDKALRYPDVWQGPGVTICRDYDARSLMIWRGAPLEADIENPETWRLANPASWMSTERLRLNFAKLRENDFRRLHLNQWTRADGAWLPRGAWTKCQKSGLHVPNSIAEPPDERLIPRGSDVFVGVDVGLKKDSSAVVTAWPYEDAPADG